LVAGPNGPIAVKTPVTAETAVVDKPAETDVTPLVGEV